MASVLKALPDKISLFMEFFVKKTQKNAINLTKHFRKELPNKNGTVFYPKISKKAKNNNILIKSSACIAVALPWCWK